MKEKNPAAVALGRLGGKSVSEAKKQASRENGKKAALKCRKCGWQRPDTETLCDCTRY